MLPWLLSIVFSSFAAKHNIIPLNLISPLSIGTPLLIGAVTEKILTKKSKSNELLKKFSSSKLQSKLIEEITKFEIEREKLVTLNKICEKLYSKFDLNDNKFKFIMNEKEYENSNINIIKSNINMINKQLIDKKNELNIIITKKFFEKRFGNLKRKSIKNTNIITTSLFGGTIFMMIYNAPIILNNSMGNIIYLKSTILSMLAQIGFGALICGIYSIKRNQIYTRASKIFSKQLKNKKSIENDKFEELKYLDFELNKLIDDICTLKEKKEIESKKIEFITNNISMKENTTREEKINTIPSILENINYTVTLSSDENNDTRNYGKVLTKATKRS